MSRQPAYPPPRTDWAQRLPDAAVPEARAVDASYRPAPWPAKPPTCADLAEVLVQLIAAVEEYALMEQGSPFASQRRDNLERLRGRLDDARRRLGVGS